MTGTPLRLRALRLSPPLNSAITELIEGRETLVPVPLIRQYGLVTACTLVKFKFVLAQVCR